MKTKILLLSVFVCSIFSSCFHDPDYYDPMPLELQTKWYESETAAELQGSNWVYHFTGEHSLLWNLGSTISKEDVGIRQKDGCLIYRDVGTGSWIVLFKEHKVEGNTLNVINIFGGAQVFYKN